MNFLKTSIILLIVSCAIINAQKRKLAKSKTKIKKSGLQNLGLTGCGCQNPLIDILNCGCRGPVVEPVYAPVVLPTPGPVIDVPKYRYAEPVEINPLGCLFPTLEVPMSVPAIEFLTIDLPCGCSGTCGCPSPCGCIEPKCGCRAPAVKLPACPCGAPIIEKCGCQGLQAPFPYGISSLIEIPSYTSIPACGSQGPCGCSGIQLSSCGCSGPCGCSSLQLSACDCLGPCGCSNIALSSCDCMGPCSCGLVPVSSCGCAGPCGCTGLSACGCSGPCNCPVLPMSCGCSGTCGCGVPVSSCGCVGPCGCPGIQMPSCGCQLPTIEVPACGCGGSGCGCNPKYLRQVTLQPPFL